MDNKTLIDNVALNCGLPREDVQELLCSFYELLAERSVEMDTLIVPGFGQFEPKKRKERISVHPSTGRRLLVPPKLVLGFRAASGLKNSINENESR